MAGQLPGASILLPSATGVQPGHVYRVISTLQTSHHIKVYFSKATTTQNIHMNMSELKIPKVLATRLR